MCSLFNFWLCFILFFIFVFQLICASSYNHWVVYSSNCLSVCSFVCLVSFYLVFLSCTVLFCWFIVVLWCRLFGFRCLFFLYCSWTFSQSISCSLYKFLIDGHFYGSWFIYLMFYWFWYWIGDSFCFCVLRVPLYSYFVSLYSLSFSLISLCLSIFRRHSACLHIH